MSFFPRSRTSLVLAALAALGTVMGAASCSSSSSGSGGGSHAAGVNLDVKSLSKSGCLNVAQVMNQLRSMPSGTMIRRATKDFQLQPVDSTDTIRRNFLSIASFAHYRFDNEPASQASDDIPNYAQSDCTTASVSDDISGTRTFKVESAGDGAVKLTGDDGSTRTWQVTGPREMVETVTEVILDPCPNYMKAQATSVYVWNWGSSDQLSSQPTHLSREYLRNMSITVLEMPDSLLTLATNGGDDAVTDDVGALMTLKEASLDPSKENCPYRATPPSSDEPPPAPDQPSPTPGPSPTPALPAH